MFFCFSVVWSFLFICSVIWFSILFGPLEFGLLDQLVPEQTLLPDDKGKIATLPNYLVAFVAVVEGLGFVLLGLVGVEQEVVLVSFSTQLAHDFGS